MTSSPVGNQQAQQPHEEVIVSVEAEVVTDAELAYLEAPLPSQETGVRAEQQTAALAEQRAPSLADVFRVCQQAVRASALGALHERYRADGIATIKYATIFLVLLNFTRWASFQWFWVLTPLFVPVLAAFAAAVTLFGVAAVSPRFRSFVVQKAPRVSL